MAGEASFAQALRPCPVAAHAPECARRMAAGARLAGAVGPMAAVAGTMAQLAVEAALAAGASEMLVENGGDCFLAMQRDLRVGLYAGNSPLGCRLALRITKEMQPVALCSSSSRMGHSKSFGDCDLATVLANDAALADALATQACNAVRSDHDLAPVIEKIAAIEGVLGILLIRGERIAMGGSNLPEIVRNTDAAAELKISADALSDFAGRKMERVNGIEPS